MGEKLGQPDLHPPPMFGLSIYLLVFGFMLVLFHCIWTCMNDIFERENQVFKPTTLLVLPDYGMGKDWASLFSPPPPPPPKCSDLSIYLSVFQLMLPLHCIWTLINDLFQRENQVIKSNSLFELLHYGVGKDWAGTFFPPSKIFWLFHLSFSLSASSARLCPRGGTLIFRHT